MNWLKNNITGTGVSYILLILVTVYSIGWLIDRDIQFRQYMAKNKLVYVKGYMSIKDVNTTIYENYKNK